MVVGAAALHYGWRAGMTIAGCLAILAGLYLCWRLRDRPQAVGLPAVGDWRHDALEIAQQQEGAGLTRKEILTRYVLANPYIWLLSLCYVLVYVVRAAINDWGNLYMSETLGVDLVTANSAVTMFELGGFIGALVAGWGSDKLFNGNRGPMNLIFAAGILLSVGGLWLMPFASYVMQAACFFTTGFFVFGPQMLIGMAAAECSHKEAAGAATGFVGLFAYLAPCPAWRRAVIDILLAGFVGVAPAARCCAVFDAQAPRTASEAFGAHPDRQRRGAIFMPWLFASRRGTTAIMSLTASISGNTRKLLTESGPSRLDLPLAVRRKMWFKPFMQSYRSSCYLTMYHPQEL
jgi:OPA family sugar phosphate sensor protein UhpC-like MFS transporter